MITDASIWRQFQGLMPMPDEKEPQLTDAEIERRMNGALRRALSTPPTPTKDIVGKSERAKAQRESRVRKASRSKPKSP